MINVVKVLHHHYFCKTFLQINLNFLFSIFVVSVLRSSALGSNPTCPSVLFTLYLLDNFFFLTQTSSNTMIGCISKGFLATNQKAKKTKTKKKPVKISRILSSFPLARFLQLCSKLFGNFKNNKSIK